MTYLEELEDRIGYHFKDRELLLTAVTHTSYANEHRKKNCQHNERLEFLGDAVAFQNQGKPGLRAVPGKMRRAHGNSEVPETRKRGGTDGRPDQGFHHG